MGNPLRECLKNHTYHTTSRCHNRENHMSLSQMRDIFFEVIYNAMQLYDFELNAYVILPNHFHLIIKTLNDEATISVIMQYIKSQYARKYNKITGRTGAFWNERFKDKIIEHSDDPGYYFNWLICYLGYNPVRKGSVIDPRDYRHSSINCYLDKNYKSAVKITLNQFFLDLGSTFKERVKGLLEFEDMYRKRLFANFLFA